MDRSGHESTAGTWPGQIRRLVPAAAAGALAASLAILFWPPLAGTYDLWVLESAEDEVLAMAEGLPLHLPAGSGQRLMKAQAAKAALIDMGSKAVDGLIEALDRSGGRPELFHHRRAYAHILCAIGDRRAAQVLARAREGDVYVEIFLLDCGYKSAAAGLIFMLGRGAGRGAGPPLRNAAGTDLDLGSAACEALSRNFRTGFGADPDRWKKWWFENSGVLRYDEASGCYVAGG